MVCSLIKSTTPVILNNIAQHLFLQWKSFQAITFYIFVILRRDFKAKQAGGEYHSGITISSPDWHLSIALDHVSKVSDDKLTQASIYVWAYHSNTLLMWWSAMHKCQSGLEIVKPLYKHKKWLHAYTNASTQYEDTLSPEVKLSLCAMYSSHTSTWEDLACSLVYKTRAGIALLSQCSYYTILEPPYSPYTTVLYDVCIHMWYRAWTLSKACSQLTVGQFQCNARLNTTFIRREVAALHRGRLQCSTI